MDQGMSVIVRSIDRDCLNSLVVADTAHIGPELRLNFFGNELLPFFGAEDHMDVDAGKGVGHSVGPPPPQHAQRRRDGGDPGSGPHIVYARIPHPSQGGLSNPARCAGCCLANRPALAVTRTTDRDLTAKTV